MTEFHFEDPDVKNTPLEIGLPSCAIAKDNFTDPQGKQIRMENKESFQAEVRKQREHSHCRCSCRPDCLKAVCHAFDWVIWTMQRIGNFNGC